MQKFDLITEADARVLPRGETVMLARRGHITPLAADTLQDRRVTVVHEGRAAADEASLVPRADIRSIAIASDHTGVALVSADEARAIVITWLGTPMREPRYIRRLAKIRDLEQR